MSFPRICGCGRSYDADAWRKLPFLGVMDDGDTGWLVLKNCDGCDSTISMPTDDPNATEIAA